VPARERALGLESAPRRQWGVCAYDLEIEIEIEIEIDE